MESRLKFIFGGDGVCMKKKIVLSILSLLCFLMVILTACNGNSVSLNLDIESVVKIEHLTIAVGRPYREREVRFAFTDETHILQIIDSINSLTLTTAEHQPPPVARMPEVLRINYSDGTISYITFDGMKFIYNDSLFEITRDDETIAEVGRLMYMLYTLHNELP